MSLIVNPRWLEIRDEFLEGDEQGEATMWLPTIWVPGASRQEWVACLDALRDSGYRLEWSLPGSLDEGDLDTLFDHVDAADPAQELPGLARVVIRDGFVLHTHFTTTDEIEFDFPANLLDADLFADLLEFMRYIGRATSLDVFISGEVPSREGCVLRYHVDADVFEYASASTN